jgi:hypothetical protein
MYFGWLFTCQNLYKYKFSYNYYFKKYQKSITFNDNHDKHGIDRKSSYQRGQGQVMDDMCQLQQVSLER